jgi:hypothetical protein
MKKIVLLCCCITSTFFGTPQNIEISFQQDARLLLIGDTKKNDPLTLNLLTKVEIPILKFKKDHISIYPSAEYANLVGGNFQRYSFGAAYAVKKIYGKFGATAFFDVGNIYRQKRSFFSLSATGELNYKLNDWLKIIGTQQLTQRNDLKILYNSKKEFLISGFFGLKFSL